MIKLEVEVHVWINGWYREMWDFLQTPHPLLTEAMTDPQTDWQADLGEIDGEEATTLGGLAASKIKAFWGYVGEFCLIVFPFIFLRVFNNFFAQHYAFRWRQAITFAYFELWSKTDKDIEGASQRVQEDPQKFALIVERLGLDFFRSVLTLIAFIPILWSVSTEIAEQFDQAVGLPGAPVDIPVFTWMATTTGSLLWVGLILAIGGTLISYFVGIKLPGLEYNNQKVEARFRKQLVYAEDDKRYASWPTLMELFTGLRHNYFRLYLHYSYFGVWSTLFSQFIIIVDLMLIGAGVVLGIITIGYLHQVGHAFGRITESLTYFVNNWTTITELMSIHRRLREFEINIGYRQGKIPHDKIPVQVIRD